MQVAVDLEYETMRRAAETAAAKVAKRGVLEWEELRQTAWRAVLECREGFDSGRGTPFGAFAFRAATYACERACWRSIRDHVRRAVLELRIYDAAEDPGPSPELDLAEWEQEVRAEVRRILAEGGVSPEAMLLVLRERSARDLSEDLGVSVWRVYNESWELRKRLRASQKLARLWKERER